MNLYARYFKRLIDFLLALLAFTLLLPVIGSYHIVTVVMANRGEPFFFSVARDGTAVYSGW